MIIWQTLDSFRAGFRRLQKGGTQLLCGSVVYLAASLLALRGLPLQPNAGIPGYALACVLAGMFVAVTTFVPQWIMAVVNSLSEPTVLRREHQYPVSVLGRVGQPHRPGQSSCCGDRFALGGRPSFNSVGTGWLVFHLLAAPMLAVGVVVSYQRCRE